ncbi:MAG: flagellar hook-associated protein FlgK [Gammaproteobacteria bacterium]|nr:flagellar hook-associated protein FlgK [Gammaproteobacteria bacterium]
MPDLLNTAVSGLLSYQRALSTTSHNIANVNTPGYSRQTVEFDTNTPSFFGGNYYGNGVRVDAVQRAYDQFLTREVRDTTSAQARAGMLADLAGYIDDVLADPNGGISPMLQDFFASVQDLADDPGSSSVRYALLGSAETLVGRFQSIDSRFEELSQNTGDAIASTVEEINSLVLRIRDVNIALNDIAASASTSQQSADLLDQRDALLDELAQKVDITVVDEGESNLSIFIGNGQAMLTGVEAFSLRAQADVADPANDVIAYNGLVTVYDISSNLTGGELGGLLEFRDQVLNPARNALGRSALGLAEAFNAQMRDGMDLNNNLGQDFFSYAGPRSIPYASNTGTATVSTVVSDIAGLTTDDYRLSFDGANWTLTSDSGSSTTVANGAPATLTFEGLTLTINGAGAAVGDSFTIKPTLAGAQSLQVITSDPAEIAAARPIRTSASLSNLGNAAISGGTIVDVTDPNLLDPASLTFDSPPTTLRADVDVVAGGVPYVAGAAIPYTDGMLIDGNGWQVSLEGAPQAGDLFSIEANLGGAGDNRNALELVGVQQLGLFDGGVASLQQDYATLVGFVGAKALGANLESDAQQALLSQATDRKLAKVSVNLDEEAADLVRFQQAYEANARLVTTAQTLFETLLDSVR